MSSQPPPTPDDPWAQRPAQPLDAPQDRQPAQPPQGSQQAPPTYSDYAGYPGHPGGYPQTGSLPGGYPQWGYPQVPATGYLPVPPPPEPPPSIGKAVHLMRLGGLVSLISLVVTVLLSPALREAQIRDGTYNANSFDGALTVACVLDIIFIGLWLWMSYANGHGRPWARIVGTVLGGLQIPYSLVYLTQEHGGARFVAFSVIFLVVFLAIAIVVLVLVWLPASSAYYAAVQRRRQIHRIMR